MANDITTGRELNSYAGDANLGTGEASGYAAMDLTPLATYALKKYETNLKDYEQQQKDKKDLEKQFNDPELYKFVDKELADQIDPYLNELKELAKENLQLRPNSEKWYRFHELHSKIIQLNANAKTVQTLKDKAKKDAGDSADPHDKEKNLAFADKLSKYKLGDEIPAYEKYFPYDASDNPTATVSQSVRERPRADGNGVEKVTRITTNPLGLLKKYDELEVTKPKARATWEDIAHTTLEKGGVPNLNARMAETYKEALALNRGLLADQHEEDYDDYLKLYPTKNLEDYLESIGQTQEIKDVKAGLQFLEHPLTYASITKDPGGKELAGFTYFPDENGVKQRLSVSDKELAAIFGATQIPPSERESVTSELSKVPAEIEALKAKTALTKEQAKTQGTIQKKNVASTKYIGRQMENLDPPFKSEIIDVVRKAELVNITSTAPYKLGEKRPDAVSEKQLLVRGKDVPEALATKAGLSPDGSYIIKYFEGDKEVTKTVIDRLERATKGSAQEMAAHWVRKGFRVEFVDQKGKVTSTTKDLDRKTVMENNKSRSNKSDINVGTGLDPDTDN